MNFILTRDKATTIPPAAMKLSGIPDNAKLELTTLDGVVILTKSKMTTMEYVKLLTALTAHVGQILLSLRDTCGHCDECDEDGCVYSNLSIYVDEDSGVITVCEADNDFDLSDVSPVILYALRKSGCCLSALEDALMENDIIYDK